MRDAECCAGSAMAVAVLPPPPDMSTICSTCGAENREGRRFCAQCGRALAAAICPACRAANEPGERFCGECGAPLAIGRAVAPTASGTVPVGEVGERKQLTVLFADVLGSMDVQEHLDAEVWARIMGRLVDILAEGVRRFGGTVDKFTGDGIMALFGAPVAQEDHARRACHAAWHITGAVASYTEQLRRDQDVDLEVRVGLNSGEVVVGRVGDDVTLDPTALGHAVGLAQRMEAMAEPGRAYLTEYTARLVERLVRPRGPRPEGGEGSPAAGRRVRVGQTVCVVGDRPGGEHVGSLAAGGSGTGAGGDGGRPGGGDRGPLSSGGRGRRGWDGQEPALRGVRRLGGRSGHHGAPDHGRLPWPGRSVAAGLVVAAGLLLDHRHGDTARGPQQGDRPPTRPRPRLRRDASAHLRLPRGARPRAPRPRIRCRGPHASRPRRHPSHHRPAQRAGSTGPAGRGPPLVRPSERRLPGTAHRVLSGVENARGDQLPSRVLGSLDAALLLPSAATGPAWRRRGGRPARRAGRSGPVAGSAARVRPRAHGWQPVLRRRGGASAGRGRHAGGPARALRADPSARPHPGSTDHPGDVWRRASTGFPPSTRRRFRRPPSSVGPSRCRCWPG